MRKSPKMKWILAVLIMILPLFIFLTGEKGETTYAEVSPDEVEIIVQYKTDIDSEEIITHSNKKIEKIKVKKEELDETLDNLRKQNHVLYVEEDAPVEVHGQPNDIFFNKQWYLSAIGADEAWKKTNVADETITVAVIDTGVDSSHVDLRGRVTVGFNFLDDNLNTMDVNGHGTAVSGIIAAIYNNQVGITGVAGNANIKILPLKVAGEDGKGKVSDMVDAIYYAAEYGVDVINISMGTSSNSTILKEAVEYAVSKDIVVVASAGNDGTSEKEYPASYPSVISVGSISKNNLKSTFSNYNEQVDFVAPGESILTTSPDDLFVYYSGTSFSSAVVSGAVAYMLATDPTLTADVLISKMEETSTDLGPAGKDSRYGYGLINLAEAVTGQNEVTPFTELILEEEVIEMSVGETTQITHHISPEQPVVWESSNTNVVQVNATGKVKAIAPGKAYVTVKTLDGSVSAVVGITVKETVAIPEKYKELESLKINGNDFYLQIKFTTGIDPESINEDTVFILDEYGENIAVEYQFESENEKVNVITDPVNYKLGKTYYLFVDQGVKSSEGKELTQPIVTQFMWDEEAGTLILEQTSIEED